ncbi:MAG: 50S ribosomal protein L24 [Bacteroidetes bacterium]|nr:50S ribosomal protein L24 [Bacteroidota bacterium]HET6245803.1 50S ribosomal protein L24 [Bacteroidia bacterium]
MPKLKIKKGDTVKVLAGNYRGQEGKILSVIIDKNRAIVEGINMVSRHTKPSSASPQGGIVKKEAPIQISNLMLVYNGTATRVGRRIENDKIVRYSKKTGEVVI